jgi:hypothetical protein
LYFFCAVNKYTDAEAYIGKGEQQLLIFAEKICSPVLPTLTLLCISPEAYKMAIW